MNQEIVCLFCMVVQGSYPNALILWENDFVSCFIPLEMKVYGK